MLQHCFADYGAGVRSPRGSAFAEGVALGSSLPDSIIVGRIAPIASGFVDRGLGRVRASFLIGLGVSEGAGDSVVAGSESDPRLLAACGETRLSRGHVASSR